MNTAEIKLDLIRQIESFNAAQLKEIYGLVLNFTNRSKEEWDDYTPALKHSISKGIDEANAGKLTPLTDVLSSIREKYKLDA